MKQIKKLLLLSVVLVLSFTFSACKKASEGDLAVQTLLNLIDRFGETKSFDNESEMEDYDLYFVTNGDGTIVIGDDYFNEYAIIIYSNSQLCMVEITFAEYEKFDKCYPDNIMINYVDMNNKSHIGLDYYHDANIWKGWEDMEPEEVNMSLNAFLKELVKMSIDDVKNLLIELGYLEENEE